MSDIGDNTKEFVFAFSKLKGKIETDEFENSGILFKFSFKSTFISENLFSVQVTAFSAVFGLLTITIFDEIKPERSPFYKKKININLNTPTPCRFKKTKFCDVRKYINNDRLIIHFCFEPQEKTASAVVGGEKRERNQAISRHIYSIYNSRMATGFVGLRNDSSTCYMNSLLQTLFNIPSFRRLIYNADQNDEIDIKSNIMKNLQILFYNLQTSKNTCSTSPLRTSFGWNDNENIFQEDVHEFFSLFLDKLIEKLRIKEQREQVESLFKFKVQPTIINEAFHFSKDLPIDIQSTLSLYIGTRTNIQDMINDMSDIMEYDFPNAKNVPSTVTEHFITLPRILFVHVIRSSFDKEKGQRFRINNPITYQERITVNLQGQNVEFVLHGILNHLSKDANYGHYVAILRPTVKDEWFSFNDSYVSRVTNSEAMNMKEECYVLVYARSDTEEEDFTEVKDEEIPESIKEMSEHASFDVIHVPFITIANIETSSVDFNPISISRRESITVPIGTNDTTTSMYSTIHETLGIKPNEQITLWECRYNGTPRTRIPNDTETKAKSYIKNRNPIFIQNGATKEGEIITIIKVFDSNQNKLQVLDSVGLLKTTKPSDLFMQIESNVNTKNPDGFLVFHEPPENQNKPVQIDASLTLGDIEDFDNGSTLIFQAKHGPVISEILEDSVFISYYNDKEKLYPLYLSMLKLSVTANLSISDDTSDMFTIKYPCDFTYSDLKKLISPILGIPYDENNNNNNDTIVLFFEISHDYFNNSLLYKNDSRQPLSPTYCYSSHDKTPYNHRQPIYTPKIYVKYIQNLKEDVAKETMKAFVVYSSEDSFNISKVNFAVEPKNTKISDIAKKYQINQDVPTKVSLMSSGRIQKCLDPNSTIEDEIGNNDYIIRIDEVFDDDESNQKNLIVNICVEKRDNSDHFEKHMSFYLPIIDQETFEDTKARILIISEIDEKDFASLRFELYTRYHDKENNSPPKCPPLKNDLILSEVNIPELCIEVLRPNNNSCIHSDEHIPIIYN